MHRSTRLFTLSVLLVAAGSGPLIGHAPASRAACLMTGAALYQQACAYCHGATGQGGVRQSAPKLWGKNNVVQNSAYRTPGALSEFIQRYMPLQPVNGVNPGSLTKTQAQSLAHYILSQQHP
ncbi:c-type cytochrome [Sulfobacillus harzensis]|uniref:C-type cytochrome n=1 Tax=Sulfobacillus harzensis TaxID=2729629 RepID=A0A7Y0L4M2_9FIRM|nr:c-type cytochrome [Sulfobacillus harzensis]NMP23211.1 c-type cytochrome [Sulfobacillus harzensis]